MKFLSDEHFGEQIAFIATGLMFTVLFAWIIANSTIGPIGGILLLAFSKAVFAFGLFMNYLSEGVKRLVFPSCVVFLLLALTLGWF